MSTLLRDGAGELGHLDGFEALYVAYPRMKSRFETTSLVLSKLLVPFLIESQVTRQST
jgi:hypothetical protein